MPVVDAAIFADTPIFQQMILERSGRTPGTLSKVEVDPAPLPDPYRPVMWNPRWHGTSIPVVHLRKKR